MRKEEIEKLGDLVIQAQEVKDCIPKLLLDDEGSLFTVQTDGSLHRVKPEAMLSTLKDIRGAAAGLHEAMREEYKRQTSKGEE